MHNPNNILTLFDPILDSNCYIVKSNMGKAIIIDPNNIEKIMKQINGMEISYILLTHEHYDHIAALNELRENVKAKVISSKKCGERIQNPRENLSSIFGVQLHFLGTQPKEPIRPYQCKMPDIVFEKQLEIDWEEYKIKMYVAPGHSPGSCLIMIGDCLFCGDSLSRDYDVIIRKKYGSKEDYKNSVASFLLKCPMNTMVFPGHGEIFRLEERREYLEKWISN